MNRTDSHLPHTDTDLPSGGALPLGLPAPLSPHCSRAPRRFWRDAQNAAFLAALVAAAFCTSSYALAENAAPSAATTSSSSSSNSGHKKTVLMVLEPNATAAISPSLSAQKSAKPLQSSTRIKPSKASANKASHSQVRLTRPALTPVFPVAVGSAMRVAPARVSTAPTAPTVLNGTDASTSMRLARLNASQRDIAISPLQSASSQNSSSRDKVALAKVSAGMKKIITVSSLKQLPPATQALPMVYGGNRRASVIAIGLDLPSKTARAEDSLSNNRSIMPAATRPMGTSSMANQLDVAAGTFVVLQTATDLDTVAIADPTIADVAVVNSRAVLVNGKTPGITSLVIVDREKIRQYQIRVLPAPGTLPRDIVAQIGLPGVTVRQVRDAIVLDGEVNNAEDARRAVAIAGIYSKKVISQLTVRGVPTDDLAVAAQIQGVIGLPNVSVSSLGDTILLQGTVDSSVQRQNAETIASSNGRKVLNLLTLPTLTMEQIQESIGTPASANSDGTNLTARQVGDQIVLEGTAANQARIEQALSVAGRTGLQVVNRASVLPPLSAESQALRSIQLAIGIPGVTVSGTPKRLVLQGVVPDSNVAVAAEQIARSFSSQVDNMLQTPNPIAINVDIQIVEINSNVARQLGVQYGSVALTGQTITPAGTTFQVPPGSPPGTPAVPITTQGSITRTTDNVFRQGVLDAGNGFIGGGGFDVLGGIRARLSALYSTGNARLLSNPRTTVLSARTATFQVGGQVPIPSGSTTGGGSTSTTIVFKDFGILLDVIPVASDNGVVTMRVRTEVSQPDPTLGVVPPGGGGLIPGFSRRSSNTEVTIEPNGTLALGGLIQNNVTKTISKVPILGDIPILGSLFRSKQFQRNQTELVIFVTPRVLPNPLAPGQIAYVGAFAAGNNSNQATTLGNQGITSFNSGSSIVSASGAAQ